MADTIETLKYVECLDDLADNEKVIFNIGLRNNCGEEAQKILANNGLESGSDITQWLVRKETVDNSDFGKYEIFSPMMDAKEAKQIMPNLIADLDKAHISSGLVVPIKARDLFVEQVQNSVQKDIASDELLKFVGGPMIRQREQKGIIFDKHAVMERIGLKSEQEIPEFFNSLEDVKRQYPKEKFLFSGTTASDDYPLVSARVGRNGTVYATPHIDYAARYDGVTNVGYMGVDGGFTATGDQYTSSVVGKIGDRRVKVGFINVYEQSNADKYFPNFGMEGCRKYLDGTTPSRTYDVYEARDGNRFADAHKQAQTAANGRLTREQAINGYIGRGNAFEKNGKVYMPLSLNAETYVTPEKNPLKAKIMHVVYGEDGFNKLEFFMPVSDKPNETVQTILDNRAIKLEDTFSHNRRLDILERFQKQKDEFAKQAGVEFTATKPLQNEIETTANAAAEQGGKAAKSAIAEGAELAADAAAKTAAASASKSGARSGVIGTVKAVDDKVNTAIDKAVEKGSEKLNNTKVGKVYDNAKKAVAKSASVQKTKEATKTVKEAVVKGAKKVGQTQAAQAVKKTVQKTGQAVAKSVAGKAVAKATAKTVGSTAAKAVGKSVLKKIPVVSVGAGLVFGAQRAMAGDFSGAALEVASGAVGTFPGVGTAASVAIDAGLAGRDIYNETQKVEDATKQQVKTDTKNAKDYGEKKAAQARQASDKAKSKADNGKQATAEKMKANAKNANKSRKQAGKTVVNANKSKAGKATVTNSATKQKQYTQINKAKSKGRE